MNIINDSQNALWIYLLCFTRIFMSMQIIPIFNATYMTNFLKLVLSVLFSLIVVPYQLIHLDINTGPYGCVMLLVKEALVGFVISYLFSFPFWLIEGAGNVIDLQRGEQFGAQVNPSTKNPSSSISKLLVQTFITYFVVFNGITLYLQLIFNSFAIYPIGSFFITNPFNKPEIFISTFSDYFYGVGVFVIPVICLLLILEVILGLISSFIPQLNVTVLAMPLKSAVALFILLFYISLLFNRVLEQYVSQFKTLFLT